MFTQSPSYKRSTNKHWSMEKVGLVFIGSPGKTFRSSLASLRDSAASTVFPNPAMPCTTTQPSVSWSLYSSFLILSVICLLST